MPLGFIEKIYKIIVCLVFNSFVIWWPLRTH